MSLRRFAPRAWRFSAVAWSGIGLVLLVAQPALAIDPSQALTQLLRDRWDAESGLPVQAATALAEDRTGYLWVGTQEGVVRFDGNRFVAFGSRTSRAFQNDLVHALAETPDGAIWVGTHSGLVRIAATTERLFGTEDGLPNPVVMALTVTADGTLWAGTGGGGVVRYDGAAFRAAGPANLDVRALCPAGDSAVWVGTERHGVFRVEARDGAGTGVALGADGPLGGATVRALAVDRDGRLWLGTAAPELFTYSAGELATVSVEGLLHPIASLLSDGSGSVWIGTRGGGLLRVRGDPPTLNVETMAAEDEIVALHEDRAGSVWFAATVSGLNRLRSPFMTTIGQAEGLSSPTALALLEDRGGRIWIGTPAGLDVLGRDGVPRPVGPPELQGSTVLSLYEDHAGTIWAGTRTDLWSGNGDEWDQRKLGVVTQDVAAFCDDPAPGVLWIGTGRGLIRMSDEGAELLTVDDGLPHDSVSLLFRDRDGVMWVGTENGGLARFVDGQLRPVRSAAHPELASTWVLSAKQDPDGSLWFGTSAGMLHLRGDRIGLITRRDGLTCDDAFVILGGADDDLWSSCIRGIARVRRADLLAFEELRTDRVATTLYTGRAQGLKGECVGAISRPGFEARDGRLWFSTLAGAVSLDPTRKADLEPAPPVVETLQAEGRPAVKPGAEPAVFAAGTRHVDIVYTAPELARPERVRFRYRLEGVDASWTDAGSRRLAIYPNLGPGHYRFELQVGVEGGPFGGESAIAEFEILPLVYQTVGFRLLVGVAAALLLFAGYRLRVARLVARRRELEEIVARRTVELSLSADEQRRMAERMKAMAEEMREQSLRDPLTGLRNRRFLLEALEPVAHDVGARQAGAGTRSPAANTGFGILLVDIDHFKRINDTHGHDAGDQVLREFARRVADRIRGGDVAARWGGEEFLIALPKTDPNHLAAFAERLREAVAGGPFVLPSGVSLDLTCSVGHAALPFFPSEGPEVRLADLVTLADMGLYAAKRNGRDRAVGVRAGGRSEVTEPMLRAALGDPEWAVAEGIVKLVSSTPLD